MQQELEKKFDIPLDRARVLVVEIINGFVANVGAEVSRSTRKCKFVYHDDDQFSLLTRGATFRSVFFDKHGKRPRHDYKEGAVNTPERVEKSWMGFPRSEYNGVHDLTRKLGVKVADVYEVAQAFTIHEKWELILGRFKVEVSYDRFYRDEDRTSLMFQELEIEYKSGLKGDFDAFVSEAHEVLKFQLGLEPVGVQKYWRVIHDRCSVKTLLSVIEHAMLAHRDLSRKLTKAFRHHDKITPYGVHPCWGAMTILQEPTLPLPTRWHGALALMLHDVLEDTTAELPGGLPEQVVKLVKEMTFESYGAELDSWWKLSDEAKLLKLYDKVSNLLDGSWMSAQKLALYRFYTLQLAEEASKHFGELNIIKIARAICL